MPGEVCVGGQLEEARKRRHKMAPADRELRQKGRRQAGRQGRARRSEAQAHQPPRRPRRPRRPPDGSAAVGLHPAEQGGVLVSLLDKIHRLHASIDVVCHVAVHQPEACTNPEGWGQVQV